MGLLCRSKVSFDSQMDLRRARGKPAAAPAGQSFRLGNLFHSEHFGIEAAGLIFLSGRHRKLDMVDAEDFHRDPCAKEDMASAPNLR